MPHINTYIVTNSYGMIHQERKILYWKQ